MIRLTQLVAASLCLLTPILLAQEEDIPMGEEGEGVELLEIEIGEENDGAAAEADPEVTEAEVEAAATEESEELPGIAEEVEEAITEAADADPEADAGGTAERMQGEEEPTIDEAIEEAGEEAAEDTGMIVPEPLPEADEFEPDESLLVEPLEYTPTYDDIVNRNPASEAREYVEPGLELRQRVAMRKAKTKALKDPDVQAAKAAAEAEPYFPEQREAYKEYYELLGKKMIQIDSSIKEAVENVRESMFMELGFVDRAPEPEEETEE